LPQTVWTIGHSTRTLDELIRILKHFGIEAVVDVRIIPRSRTNPQFDKDALGPALEQAGIHYIHMKDLGGLRKPRKDSTNTGWENESFRGYADYMQTPLFEQALAGLVDLAKRKHTVIMCAETLPWHCHRSLIADALVARGFDVIDIFSEDESRPHKLTSFARVEDGKVTYPALFTRNVNNALNAPDHV
jgi:uncharacterized protein (DUF488 family)